MPEWKSLPIARRIGKGDRSSEQFALGDSKVLLVPHQKDLRLGLQLNEDSRCITGIPDRTRNRHSVRFADNPTKGVTAGEPDRNSIRMV